MDFTKTQRRIVAAQLGISEDALPDFDSASAPLEKVAASEIPTPPEDLSSQGGSGNEKRAIPKGHEFDPRALKPMARALFTASVALGHALSAYRHIYQIKSSTVSPDGKLGGRGYVMSIKELRTKLYEVSNNLSDITDTLQDELTAEHWKPRLGELSNNEADDIAKLISEARKNLVDPEDGADDQVAELEAENDDSMPKQAMESNAPGGPRIQTRSPGDGSQVWNPWTDPVDDDWGYGSNGPEYDPPNSSALPGDWSTERTTKDLGLGWGSKERKTTDGEGASRMPGADNSPQPRYSYLVDAASMLPGDHAQTHMSDVEGTWPLPQVSSVMRTRDDGGD